MLSGVRRPDLKDAVYSLARGVDWRVRSLLARHLGVGTALDVMNVAVIGESIAPDSLAFNFDKVLQLID